MGRFDACIASAYSSAGVIVVTTKTALFYGISGLGSADATTIVVHRGGNTAGATVNVVPAGAAAAINEGPLAPIVCSGGIAATNIGTVAGYVVLYANLE